MHTALNIAWTVWGILLVCVIYTLAETFYRARRK